MQLSTSQQRILADMGIELWALRRPEAPSPKQPVVRATVDSEQTTIDIAAHIALVVVTETSTLSEAAQRLFAAMLKAVALKPGQVMTVNSSEFKQINTVGLAGKSVLLLGSTVTEQIMPDLTLDKPEAVSQYRAQFSASYSLEELLQQPSRKASAWQALKQLKSLF